MKERPILFSAPMVRALLAGTKTQTRRVMTLQPHVDASVYVERFNQTKVDRHGDEQPGPEVFGAWWQDGEFGLKCPFGQPGDRLWVRETHFAFGRWETRYNPKKGRDEWHFVDMTKECGHEYAYAADDHSLAPHRRTAGAYPCWWKRPAIFMPRVACRLDLGISVVRAQQLQDISADDAKAEGITFTDYGRKCGHTGSGWADVGNCPAPQAHHPQRNGWSWRPTTSPDQCMHSPQAAFLNLWLEINSAGSWDANPWVWAVEFRVLEQGRQHAK